MKYYISCLRKETQASETADCSPSEGENIGRAICDSEIVPIVKSEIIANFESEIQEFHPRFVQVKNVTFNSDTNFKPHI